MEAKPSQNAEPSRKDELKKELESYKANKPWREDLSVQAEKKGGEKKAVENKAPAGEKKEAPKKAEKPAPQPEDDGTMFQP